MTSNWTLTSDCTYTSEDGPAFGANGITLDCKGYSIKGAGSVSTREGVWNIEGKGVTGDTVQNCHISGGWGYGMYFEGMSGLTVWGNKVIGPGPNGYYGIYLEYVGPATETGNNVTGYSYAFYYDDVSQLTVTGNFASGVTAPTGHADGGFYVDYCGFDITFTGNTAKNFTNWAGFAVEDSGQYSECNGFGPGGTLSKNTATGNEYGFYMDDSAGFTLSINRADYNTYYGYYDDTTGPAPLALGTYYVNNECSHNTLHGSYDDEAGLGPAFLCTPQG
jgi:parallel beta-helix repeat protein